MTSCRPPTNGVVRSTLRRRKASDAHAKWRHRNTSARQMVHGRETDAPSHVCRYTPFSPGRARFLLLCLPLHFLHGDPVPDTPCTCFVLFRQLGDVDASLKRLDHVERETMARRPCTRGRQRDGCLQVQEEVWNGTWETEKTIHPNFDARHGGSKGTSANHATTSVMEMKRQTKQFHQSESRSQLLDPNGHSKETSLALMPNALPPAFLIEPSQCMHHSKKLHWSPSGKTLTTTLSNYGPSRQGTSEKAHNYNTCAFVVPFVPLDVRPMLQSKATTLMPQEDFRSSNVQGEVCETKVLIF